MIRRAALGAGLTLLVCCGSASATSVTDAPYGSGIVINGYSADAAAHLTVTQSDDSHITIHDAAGPVTNSSSQCDPTGTGDVSCVLLYQDEIQINALAPSSTLDMPGVMAPTVIYPREGVTYHGGPGPTIFRGVGGDMSGGGGIDTVVSTVSVRGLISLNDAPDDGDAAASTFAGNAHSDIEDIYETETVPTGSVPVMFYGSAAANVLDASDADDVLDGAGGPDVFNAYGGDDMIVSRDGSADRIDCGAGDDTVIADQRDTLGRCEHVDVAQVTPVVDTAQAPPPDRPPTLSIGGVRPGRHVGVAGVAVQLNAADDQGIAKVDVLAGDRRAATVSAAPYGLRYLPTPADIGRTTLVAIATDTSGRTATAAVPIVVDRFAPRGLTARLRRTGAR